MTLALRKDVATAENRWGGTNKGGYTHPEYDRLLDGFNAALDRAERNNSVIGMMRMASEELPALPLYGAPASLRPTLARALALRPADRFQSARELRAALVAVDPR